MWIRAPRYREIVSHHFKTPCLPSTTPVFKKATQILQDSPIQIGPISLQGFEVPPSVRFGGRHRLAVHKLSGGRRIIERLGPDDDEIAFQGTFSGSNAEARVRAFDNLRLSGEIVWLTWESFRRQIVVKDFVAEYHSPWWIPYRVRCTVVHQAGVSIKQTSKISSLISADLTNALSAASGAGVSLSSLQTALSGANAGTAGTLGQAQAATTVETTLDAVDAQITLQSALLVAPAEANTEPGSFAPTLVACVNGAGQLAAAVNVRSYIGRIGSYLTGPGQ